MHAHGLKSVHQRYSSARLQSEAGHSGLIGYVQVSANKQDPTMQRVAKAVAGGDSYEAF
jgi:hypothetical protein